MQEDAVGTQPRVVFMHKCMQLECWPATAIVSQLHQAHISLPYVIMDTKSKPTLRCTSEQTAQKGYVLLSLCSLFFGGPGGRGGGELLIWEAHMERRYHQGSAQATDQQQVKQTSCKLLWYK